MFRKVSYFQRDRERRLLAALSFVFNPPSSPKEMVQWARRRLALPLQGLVLVFMSEVLYLLTAFSCIQMDASGEKYLHYDPRTKCWSPQVSICLCVSVALHLPLCRSVSASVSASASVFVSLCLCLLSLSTCLSVLSVDRSVVQSACLLNCVSENSTMPPLFGRQNLVASVNVLDLLPQPCLVYQLWMIKVFFHAYNWTHSAH